MTRIELTDAMLVRREQGDAGAAPRPFLATSAEDRRHLSILLTELLGKEVA
jgi:hypothetical protein